MNKHSLENYPTRLAESARRLLSASSTATDHAVKEARIQLETVLENGKHAFADIRKRTSRNLHAVEGAVQEHPYAVMGVAFALGVLIAFAVKRTSK